MIIWYIIWYIVNDRKAIRFGTCQVSHQYLKANNKYVKNCDKNNEYCVVNNLYGCVISQKLPLGDFNWVENTSYFSKNFVENCNEDGGEEYFLEVDVCYADKLQLITFILTNYGLWNYYPFCLKEWKLKKLENFYPTNFIKNSMLYT